MDKGIDILSITSNTLAELILFIDVCYNIMCLTLNS